MDFNFVGYDEYVRVDPGVTSLELFMQGGNGAGVFDRGGRGGGLHGFVSTTPGEILTVRVGSGAYSPEEAHQVTSPGFPGGGDSQGGGAGGNVGGAGGGYSALLRSDGTVIAVAGGGGGAGSPVGGGTTGFGGAGGGTTGQDGNSGAFGGGTAGLGGTPSAGGAAGFPGGVAGSALQGGGSGGTGGGGGAGWFGGGQGGGGTGPLSDYSGGAGGGSSYTNGDVTSVTHSQGANFAGNGSISLLGGVTLLSPTAPPGSGRVWAVGSVVRGTSFTGIALVPDGTSNDGYPGGDGSPWVAIPSGTLHGVLADGSDSTYDQAYGGDSGTGAGANTGALVEEMTTHDFLGEPITSVTIRLRAKTASNLGEALGAYPLLVGRLTTYDLFEGLTSSMAQYTGRPRLKKPPRAFEFTGSGTEDLSWTQADIDNLQLAVQPYVLFDSGSTIEMAKLVAIIQ